jgi:hypothetical protein
MATPKDKNELQKAIIENYKKLKTELLSIPTDLTTTKELEGHSKNTLMIPINARLSERFFVMFLGFYFEYI